jgi:hypothetical protein
MHKFLEKWNALPVHKQASSLVVGCLLSYFLYQSVAVVLVMPVINYLQQGEKHEP